MNYGEYFGLDARNSYVATSSLGNLGDREPMQAVYRTAGLARPVGGTTPQVWVITTTGTMAGEVSLSPLPTGYTGSETGTYALERGGTAYEFTNHLGNVLAVVSDKKLGQGGTTLAPTSTYYHPHTAMLTDYYPFGSPMVGRTWQSEIYRYGFNGMQKDNEIVGEANGYDFGARLYDGRVGRWLSVDPMWKKYPSMGPFSFVKNSPLIFIDKNGEDIYIYDKKGRVLSLVKCAGPDLGFKLNFVENTNNECPKIVDMTDSFMDKYIDFGYETFVPDMIGIGFSAGAIIGDAGKQFGFEIVLFLRGQDPMEVGVYGYIGGGLGKDIGLGPYVFAADYLPNNSSFDKESYEGLFESYSFNSSALGGISVFWGNENNEPSGYPTGPTFSSKDRSDVTWWGVAYTLPGLGVGKFGAKYAQNDYTLSPTLSDWLSSGFNFGKNLNIEKVEIDEMDNSALKENEKK